MDHVQMTAPLVGQRMHKPVNLLRGAEPRILYTCLACCGRAYRESYDSVQGDGSRLPVVLVRCIREPGNCGAAIHLRLGVEPQPFDPRSPRERVAARKTRVAFNPTVRRPAVPAKPKPTQEQMAETVQPHHTGAARAWLCGMPAKQARATFGVSDFEMKAAAHALAAEMGAENLPALKRMLAELVPEEPAEVANEQPVAPLVPDLAAANDLPTEAPAPPSPVAPDFCPPLGEEGVSGSLGTSDQNTPHHEAICSPTQSITEEAATVPRQRKDNTAPASYSAEQKADLFTLVFERGMETKEAAVEIGIHPASARKYVQLERKRRAEAARVTAECVSMVEASIQAPVPVAGEVDEDDDDYPEARPVEVEPQTFRERVMAGGTAVEVGVVDLTSEAASKPGRVTYREERDEEPLPFAAGVHVPGRADLPILVERAVCAMRELEEALEAQAGMLRTARERIAGLVA